MVLRDGAPKLETFVWIFNDVLNLNSITWSMIDLKASNVDRWPIPMLFFM